jgi:hypothetical protein
MTKISDLPLIGTITGTDQMLLLDPESAAGSRSKKVTMDLLGAFLLSLLPTQNYTFVEMSQALYDALPTKDPKTVYLITA